MSALWLAVAFVAGWVLCWKTSGFLLRRVLKNAGPTMTKAVAGLSQESLLKVYAAASLEVEKRKMGVPS